MNQAQAKRQAQGAKAVTVRTTFSRETSVGIDILADGGVVWALLTNAADVPRWNSTVVSMKGEIREGGRIELISTLDPNRVFKLKVKEFEPAKRLAWGDATGTRFFTIAKSAGESVAFTMTEKIGGPFFPVFAKYIPPFDAAFEQFAADLKKEAESIQRSKR